jgi:hypothetical protein
VTGRNVPAAVATVLGLLGCGPATVGRAAFERRGNAICAVEAARIAQLAAPHQNSTGGPVRMAGYVDAYVAEVRQELNDLRPIGFPAGERRQLSDVYDDLDAALTAVEGDPLSFRASAFAKPAAELRAAGLTACRP